MSTSCTISPLAYLKLILHSAKYPSSSICGLLLSSTTNDNVVVIDDAIPLLHHWTTLSPMMEAGLQLADTYLQSTSSKLVGLYLANSHLNDTSVPPTLSLVADKLRAEFPQAVVVVIDNDKLGSSESPLIPHTSTSGTWKPSPITSLTLSDPTIIRTSLVRARKGDYSHLGDFDDHLEDSSVDWLKNAQLTL